MTISRIEIRNIKGIDHKLLEVTISPNKPNLLVAPNGFGKSSIATAFACMNSRRLVLAKADHYRENDNHAPSLEITLGGNVLVADGARNEIRANFDVSVIRSGLTAKATQIKAGNFSQAIASLEVNSIEVCTIPARRAFDYRSAEMKAGFGGNGKILPNISELLKNSLLLSVISVVEFSRFTQARNSASIDAVVDVINKQAGTSDVIHQWIGANLIDRLRAIVPLNEVAQHLHRLNLADSEVEAFLAAYQISKLYEANKEHFNCCSKAQL